MTYAYQARQKIKFRELLDAGNLMFATGDNSRALAKFREAARLNPSDADVWFGIGDALVGQVYESGESKKTALSEAIEAYRKAIEIEKRKNATAAQHEAGQTKLAGAYVGLGNVYIVGDDPDFSKAEALYKQAEAADAGSPDPHVGYHLAIDQFQAALKAARQRDTPNYGAHAGLGSAYFSLGHYRLAMEEFNRAIGASPGSDIVRFRLANALHRNDPNDPQATVSFQSLIGSTMKRLDSLSRMNLAYIILENAKPPIEAPLLGKAVRFFEEAYEKDPYAYSAFRLGIGRALEGNWQEASRLWDETAKLPWGGDSLSRRTYLPLLAVLRSEPGCLARMQEMTQFLAQEGALGFLETVKRDAEMIRTSEVYNAEIIPAISLLDEAIAQAREHNNVPASGLEPANSPPP